MKLLDKYREYKARKLRERIVCKVMDGKYSSSHSTQQHAEAIIRYITTGAC